MVRTTPAGAACSGVAGEIRAELATGRGGNHRPDGFCCVLGGGGLEAWDSAPLHISELGGLAARLLPAPAAR